MKSFTKLPAKKQDVNKNKNKNNNKINQIIDNNKNNNKMVDKNNPITEVRKFEISYTKTEPIDLEYLERQYEEMTADFQDSEEEYRPYNITQIQHFNPIYKLLFDLTPETYDGISLNHLFQMENLTKIKNAKTQCFLDKNVFIKFSPILDPIRYMIGKYDMNDEKIRTLPNLNSDQNNTLPKIASFNNASYIDGFFSFLSSSLLHTNNFTHGIDFYGSYLGIQDKFKFAITDDLDYLRESDFFKDNLDKLFTIKDNQDGDINNELRNLMGSRGNKQKLCISKSNINVHNSSIISITSLDDLPIWSEPPLETPSFPSGTAELGRSPTPNGSGSLQTFVEMIDENLTNDDDIILDINNDLVYEKISKPLQTSSEKSHHSSRSSSSDSSDNSKLNYSSEEEEDSGDDSGNDSGNDSDNDSSDCSGNNSGDDSNDEYSDCSDESEIYGYIHNFPIQMICLEKCEGTMDELFSNKKLNDKTSASALFQIIMILLTYQKVFKFTHNDLHTNNIMYVSTNTEFLYYKYCNKQYRVPTYGKIFKLIDFGRSIYKYQGKTFCSDSFAPGGDASTQYNFEPFFNEKKPRLDPNYSFDLCRLGTSIYDFIIDDDEVLEKMNDLQKTIYRWCLDDNGKNVLYMKNGEERYPNFKLYKMIARTVHNHTPEAQLEFPFFKQFLETGKKKAHLTEMNIDTLPCYA